VTGVVTAVVVEVEVVVVLVVVVVLEVVAVVGEQAAIPRDSTIRPLITNHRIFFAHFLFLPPFFDEYTSPLLLNLLDSLPPFHFNLPGLLFPAILFQNKSLVTC